MSRTVSYELPQYLAARRAARRSERLVQVVCLVIAAAALAGASLFVTPMNQVRVERQMVIDPESIKGLPPMETLLAKTATLRALAIDMAFIRSERLKEEGKYYEAMQLADWICRLAPRFPSIWRFHAWNQAYNISVATYTPEERWKWVSNGIDLLRNQGIRYNPKSVGLYRELAWIFWHKIGEFADDHHWSYKKEVAVEMERVLGPPPTAEATEDIIEPIRRIAESPPVHELIQQDEEVADLVRRLADLDLDPDQELLAFVARYVRHDVSVKRFLASVEETAEAESLQSRRVRLLSESETAEARARLLSAVRSEVLQEDFNMHPPWMLELMERYGPIDWRGPFAHSLYWASWGDMVTRGQINLNPNDSMNTARAILNSLKFMVEKGRMVLIPDWDNPNDSYIDLLPDLRFIDPLHQAYLDISRAQFGNWPTYREGESAQNYRVGHFSFLADAVRVLYMTGLDRYREKAQYYYDYLRRVNRNPDGSPKESFMQPLEDYVLEDLKDSVEGYRRTKLYVGQVLRRSLYELALGNADASVSSVDWAKEIREYYMKAVGAAEDRTARRSLERMVFLRRDALVQYLLDPGVAMLHKARVWDQMDELTRQMSWDIVEPYLIDLCARQQPPWDPAKAFPEPPGMEEYRANPLIEMRQKGEEDVEEGEKNMDPIVRPPSEQERELLGPPIG